MNCANTKHINDFLNNQDKDIKENEKYELEFLEILSNLKIYAMKNDKYIIGNNLEHTLNGGLSYDTLLQS